MRKTYKYRVYPTKRQMTGLEQILEECRWVYNETLALRKNTWEERQETLSLYDSQKLLTVWKRERPSLNIVYSQVLQNVQMRVDLAYKAFFRRVKVGENPGYPRFKGRGRYRSITYPQSGFGITDGGKLHLSKIGDIKIKLHRPIMGNIKTLTIRRYTTGKWFACFSTEVKPKMLPETNGVIGIDLGLASFATLSDGTKIDNPRFFRKEEGELVKTQRKLSKCKEGSPERRKKRKVVARIHEHIANKRTDFSHKLSRRLVNEYGTIVFEDLNIADMTKNSWRGLNKSIADATWNQLVLHTTYKAENAGRQVVLVDPRNTSKMCSRCGMLVEKPLSCRIHSCPYCGLELDRDHNAAINILRLGLQSVGKIPRSLRL